MKRLNKKGFTLIELLAVIVILAIVLVVTIPSVINALNSARTKSLQNAADTVADWFTKNYELDDFSTSLGSNTVEAAYTTFKGTFGNGNTWTTQVNNANKVYELDAAVLEAAGISNAATTIDEHSYVQLQGKKICVTLNISSDSQLYVSGSTSATSAGCTTVINPK